MPRRKVVTQAKVDRARDALQDLLDCDDKLDHFRGYKIMDLARARDALTMIVR